MPNKGVLHFRHSPARTTEVSGKDNPLWIYTEICEGQIYTQYGTFKDVENSE